MCMYVCVVQALQGGHGSSETELTDHMTLSWQEADTSDEEVMYVCVASYFCVVCWHIF